MRRRPQPQKARLLGHAPSLQRPHPLLRASCTCSLRRADFGKPQRRALHTSAASAADERERSADDAAQEIVEHGEAGPAAAACRERPPLPASMPLLQRACVADQITRGALSAGGPPHSDACAGPSAADTVSNACDRASSACRGSSPLFAAGLQPAEAPLPPGPLPSTCQVPSA